MSSVSNTLKQYLELGISRLEAGNPQPAASLFSADVERAISLLSKFNNAVFIVENQDENEIIVETINKFCRDATGKVFKEAFQIDAKQFIKASDGQPNARLEEIFDVLENENEKVLLVVTSLEEFAKDERLARHFENIIKKSAVPLLGVTTLDGFRQLEKIPDLSGCLQFILCEKTRHKNKRDKSVLIIGASSFFGSAVYQLFGSEFRLVRGTGFSKAGILDFDKLDVTSEDEIKKYFSNQPDFDIVIYIAGEADADAAEKEKDRARTLNVDAVSILARYAKHCKFVYISSEYVFDGSTGPYGSCSEAKPINYYGRTKLEGEKVSLSNFPYALVLRLGALYGYNGPADKKTSVSKIVSAMDKNEALEADNVQIKHPVLLEDAAGTLLKLLDYGATGIFQTNGPEGLNKLEMAKYISTARSEVDGRFFSYPIIGIEQAGVAAKPLNTHMVNVDTPRPFNEGVRFMLMKLKTPKKKDCHGS